MTTEERLLAILYDWRDVHWGLKDDTSEYDETDRNDVRDEIELWDGKKRDAFLLKFIRHYSESKTDFAYTDVCHAVDFIRQVKLA